MHRAAPIVLCALCWVATLPSPVRAQRDSAKTAATRLADQVARITRGNSSAERAAAIAALLDKFDIEYESSEFEHDDLKGRNLSVRLKSEAKRTLLLGAHLDQVQVGNGAIDNACSCAALLTLLERFRDRPLRHHQLQVVFFDLEERGLLGSQAWVKTQPPPALFLNFDIFGYGDALWLMSQQADHPAVAALEATCKEADFSVAVSPMNEYPPGDHVPFAKAEIPTIGIALIDEPEIQGVQDLLRGRRHDPPPILKTIHTDDDTIDRMEPQECWRALLLIEKAIRRLDDATANP